MIDLLGVVNECGVVDVHKEHGTVNMRLPMAVVVQG